MDDWVRLGECGTDEQRLRWLLRHHAAAMVTAGVAVKFGREWRIHRARLPEYLQRLTLESLNRQRAQG
jgi:hypothetical protein